MTPAQQDKLLEDFRQHLIDDAAQNTKQQASADQLQRIEVKVDMLVSKWQQVTGMRLFVVSLFLALAPAVGGIMWVMDHFKR